MSSGGRAPAIPSWRRIGFVVLMLGLTALFVGLGVWQWQRLEEKEALIATVAARMNQAAVDLPPAAKWTSLDAEFHNYRPIGVTGQYVPHQTVLVFTSLGDARGEFGGPGYWVMTPLSLEGGGTLFVNRGFIPESSKAAFAAGGTVEPGAVTLSGIARLSEEAGAFTPATDAANRIEWVRSIERLSRLSDPSLAPFAPLYLDLPAGAQGALPQGGETIVTFPNNHFGYALTWFGFALLTPILLIFWLRRERQPVKP